MSLISEEETQISVDRDIQGQDFLHLKILRKWSQCMKGHKMKNLTSQKDSSKEDHFLTKSNYLKEILTGMLVQVVTIHLIKALHQDVTSHHNAKSHQSSHL